MKNTSTYKTIWSPFMVAIILSLLISCNQDNSTSVEVLEEPVPVDTVSIAEKEIIKEEKPPFIVNYYLDSIATSADVDSFNTRYSEEQRKVIFALNRVDEWRFAPGDQLIVPDTLSQAFLLYSPFPETLEFMDSIPKAVLINQRVQGFALYEKGKLIRWGPTSSGKQSTPTPNGLHYGNHKSKRKVSTVNPDWILPYYFNFMNFEGVGVHQYSMPGYPASHACVRLQQEDAEFIYNWAEQWQLNDNAQVIVKNGTPFMVFGEYDYENPSPPWLRMAGNHEENFLNAAERDTLKAYCKRYFEDERNFKNIEEEIESELSV